MKITVSRHIFGSVRGYTTLAKSEDLSPEEIADLEIFSFGQTNESTYMNSLETEPAYISRPLRSGRWAVTRVFQGKPDEHNRTTLLFVSAVITTEDWVYLLKCDVNKLLYYRDLWQWDGKEKLEPIEVAVEGGREAADAEIRSRVLCLVAAVEKYSSDKNTTIIVRASDFDVEVLRLLNMVLPLKLKQGFSCAARALNDGLPLTVVSMAEEGSLGNSKRGTINWTRSSSADDCVYTESLAGFWPPGAEPPWQFIDRCRSFSIDLEAARVSGLDERVVRRKRLRYEIKKPGVRSKRHISWKLGLIFLGCAVLICAGTGIAIRATLAKAEEEKKVAVLVEKARGFLDGNSLKKGFPADRTVRQQVINECEELRYEVEELFDRTEKPVLQALTDELDRWLRSADHAHQSYDALEGLHQQFVALKLSEEPTGYPVRKRIESVENLKKSLRAQIKRSKYLLPSYISRQKETLKVIDGWLDAIGRILSERARKVATLVEDVKRQTEPTYYSAQEYEKHENWKAELQTFKEDESLRHAKDSPFLQHKRLAVQSEERLKDTLQVCSETLEKLAGWKNDAEKSGGEFDSRLSDPNVSNGNFKNFDTLKEAREHLRKAHGLWPDKYNLVKDREKLNGKLKENFEKYVEKHKGELDKIETPVGPSDPNAAKLDTLLEEIEKVEEYLKESGVPDVSSLLERLNEIEEEAVELRSTVRVEESSVEN